MIVPISFEYFLSRLFGKRAYHGFVGSKPPGRWKNHLLGMLRAIETAATVTVSSTDSLHKARIGSTCERCRESLRELKGKDEINARFIQFLTEMVFVLLGDLPDHWDAGKVTNPKQWRLDDHRTVVYAQNDEQRAAVILSLHRTRETPVKAPSSDELATRWRDFGHYAPRFVAWFRAAYPHVYHQVF